MNPKTTEPPRTQQARQSPHVYSIPQAYTTPQTGSTPQTKANPETPQAPQARRTRPSRPAWLAGLRWRAVHWGWEAAQRAGMVTADTPAGRRFAAFGPGSMTAFPPGSVFGEGSIAIGADTLIGALVTMSAGMVPGQDLGPAPVLRIGDRCVIGRGSHIVAHHSLVIENDVFAGPYVYITDQNHGYADPETPIGLQLPHNAAVRIGSGSWLGTGAIVLPGASIGRNVVIAAGSVVRGTIPDQCVAAGVPARVIRRYHPSTGWSPSTAPASSASAASAGPADLAVVHPAHVAERVDGVAQASDPLR